MSLKKQERTGNDLGIGARRIFTVKELVYIIGAVLAAIGAGTGSNFLVKDNISSKTLETVTSNTKAIETNCNDIRMLSSEIRNYIQNTKDINTMRDKNIQIQIDNIEEKVTKIEEGQKDVMRGLGKVLEKVK